MAELDARTLDWALTGLGLLLGLGLIVLGNWRAGLPPDPLRPRMVSWNFITLLAGLWCVMMVVHAVNLLGFETGRQALGLR